MKFKLRRNTLAFWFASLGASATLAIAGAMVVLADADANPCLVHGQPQSAEWAAQHADECDAGTGPNAEAASEPAPAPAETPPAPPVEPAAPEAEAPGDPVAPDPSAPAAAPAPAEPAPADAAPTAPASAPTAEPPAAAPAPDVATAPQQPAAAPATPAAPTKAEPRKQPARSEAKAPQVEPEVAPAPDRPRLVLPTPFRDAILFRESFTPKGRIPELPKLAEERAQLLVVSGKQTKVKWSLLASLAWMDSRWGNQVAGGFVGSRLSQTEWRQFGVDGDGDGRIEAASEADSVATVAAFVESFADKGGTGAALRSYFDGKMPKVRRAHYLAAYYDAFGPVAVVKGLGDEKAQEQLAERVLEDTRIELYPGGQFDVEAGLIDPRVLVTLEFLANRFGKVGVSSLISGHNVFTTSGNVSLHSYGQAVDIASLGGKPIYGNQAKGSATEKALKDVLRMPTNMQPKELISLWDLGGASFALSDHDDHIHVGFVKEEEQGEHEAH